MVINYTELYNNVVYFKFMLKAYKFKINVKLLTVCCSSISKEAPDRSLFQKKAFMTNFE